ncbi:MAG: adenosylcobinamide-phosphate synthase CbiB, partial [Acidimicrobiales bacterium]
GSAAVGLALDQIFGEPPSAVHPVALFGTGMTRLEARLWSDRRCHGAIYAAVGIGAGVAVGRVVRSTALAVGLAVAARELRIVARSVGDHLLDGDIDTARRELPALVGRDPSSLDESGIAAAAIESVAENAVDAVVAPVFWAVVGGAPGVLAYRAINTMDAMVGRRNSRYARFGWASARIDDVANWLPARLYAALVAGTDPSRSSDVVRLVRRDAGAHPSPNAGVAETAMAAALGRNLGGPLSYGDQLEDRPRLGDGPRPDPKDVGAALDVAARVEKTLTGILIGLWALGVLARRLERPPSLERSCP